MKLWDNSELPRATDDIAVLKSDLDHYGYAIVKSGLTRAQTAAMRERLAEQADLEREHGLEITDHVNSASNTNQWVYGLVNKGRVFLDSLTQPVVQELVGHVLGRHYVLSDLTAHITRPGNQPMGLHTDQWYFPPLAVPGDPAAVKAGDHNRSTGAPQGDYRPATTPILPAMGVNVMWMLCDFTVENGATVVVPRSHLSGQQPKPGEAYETVPVTGEEGNVIIWDARIWHAAGLNTGTTPRFGLVTPYRGPQLRSRVNFPYALQRDVLAELGDEVKRLLGFTPWQGAGHTDDPKAEIVKPGDETVGELRRGGTGDPTSPIEQFWLRACEALGIDPAVGYAERMFGDPEMAGADIVDGLAAAVREGKKRGTSPCRLHLERNNLPLPEVGAHWVVLDSRRRPHAVVRVTKVETTQFDKVDDAWAEQEGEADRSLEYWQAIHRWWFRKVHARWGVPWSEEAPVVLIHFEPVYTRPH